MRGKRAKSDVQIFSFQLMDNILALASDLRHRTYRHGGYYAFNVSDPKPRRIHKASVRDRLLHHALYRLLYPFFDRVFIADSFSCRNGKGTHKAFNRFRSFFYAVSRNNTRTCWVLKCDIKKFFEHIDHEILLRMLRSYIPDKEIIGLLQNIIESFSATRPSVGVPLGNLTSQLFVNIYMNAFDQFVKHELKEKYYIRYGDDFVFLSEHRIYLEHLISLIRKFLRDRLRLELHPGKVSVRTFASGVDFLGWVHFPDHRVLRSATRRRMMRRLKVSKGDAMFQSYLGLLRHGNTYNVRKHFIAM